ncbi:glycerophosphodiester phosphodiesterase family protein [Nocardioides sp.]|uniref:glycerophosphodiester phosphodiesterase family protein n=1 Tax=Nocardioides sp. TaxID=35761 RepID=UPI0025FBD00B|nr:glycerophosphodiester phosphodiesterase family protein [Nocardioides sp.]
MTPLVIAHRGASGYRPEHTLASYRLAIALGADFVEPDLVATRDGVLVARHEAEIGGTTDVANRREFAGRRTTKVVDGREVTGWFVEDFTLAELKTLRAVERLPDLRPRNTRYDGRYEVPTFDEILTLVEAESQRLGRAIGVYPETKHPSYFATIGLALEEPLLAALAGRDLPVFVQSFEPGNLRWLRSRTSRPLVQLVSATGRVDLVTGTGLRRVAEYADAVGVDKELVSPGLVADAHAAGLQVHVWTLRDETDSIEDTQALVGAGVDGLFTDHPDTTLEACRLQTLQTSGIRIHAAT